MTDNAHHIDALLNHLGNGYWPEKHEALTALVAERDALRERVLRREADINALADSNAILRERLEANPLADRDRELRERLVCAALTGVWIQGWTSRDAMVEFAVGAADAAIAAMRKGEQNGK